MAALADLLSETSRKRLAFAVYGPDVAELADAARKAADDAHGTDRWVPWVCVTVALGEARTVNDVREHLDGMLEDGELKTSALDCLAELCSASTGPEGP